MNLAEIKAAAEAAQELAARKDHAASNVFYAVVEVRKNTDWLVERVEELAEAGRAAVEVWCEDDGAEWGMGNGWEVMRQLEMALGRLENKEAT